jgi:hypothetical protein
MAALLRFRVDLLGAVGAFDCSHCWCVLHLNLQKKRAGVALNHGPILRGLIQAQVIALAHGSAGARRLEFAEVAR